MRFAMSSSPHIRCSDNTRRIMLDVLIALLPTLLAGTIFFGLRCLLLAAVSIAAAGLAEALWNKLTRRYQTVEDLSAAVTGLLLVLTLPATVPYWMAAVGAVFAVIVVKAAFGGLGQNIFNPALAARALLLLLFPASMTRFVAPGTSIPLDLRSADVVTAATPLHSMVMPALPDVPLSEMFLGSIGGCIGEVSALALLIGGGYLVVRGVIKLRIPVSYLGTMAVLSFAFAPMEPLRWMLYSLLGGGVLLGALFMASDYATSPATPGGQVLYGIGCGVLTVLFRSVGLYPEGVTYAILLMNAASWLLERFTPTRLFGAPQRKGGLSAGSLLLAGLILVVAGNAVAPAAAANAAAEQQEMMETLLPGSTVFTPEEDTGTDANITAVWKGEGGWIIETTVDGYAGPIRQWTGVDSNGHVTGLVVRDMEETFGLGRNALTDIDFLVQFVGTSGEAEVGGGVDAITGATVTSRAVARGVSSACAYVTGADVSTSATEWGG